MCEGKKKHTSKQSDSQGRVATFFPCSLYFNMKADMQKRVRRLRCCFFICTKGALTACDLSRFHFILISPSPASLYPSSSQPRRNYVPVIHTLTDQQRPFHRPDHPDHAPTDAPSSRSRPQATQNLQYSSNQTNTPIHPPTPDLLITSTHQTLLTSSSMTGPPSGNMRR